MQPRPEPRQRVRVKRALDADVDSRGRSGSTAGQPQRRDEINVTGPDRDANDELPKPVIEILHEADGDVRPSAPRRGQKPPRPTVTPKVPPRRPDVPTGRAATAQPDDQGTARTSPRPRPEPRPTLETTVSEPAAPHTRPVGAPDPTDGEGSGLERVPGAVDPLVIEQSTFGSAPWWSRGWWRITPGGAARDILCDAGTAGPLAAAAVSLRGHKHRLDAAPNDDAFSLCIGTSSDGMDWLIGCVCDGVGSAARASEGSALVATAFANALADLCARPEWAEGSPDSETLAAIVEAVRARVAEQAGVEHSGLEAFETTLTFVVVPTSRRADGTRRALIGWTGDSPALILRDGVWTDPTDSLAEEATGPSSTRTAGFLTSPRLEGFVNVDLAADDVVMLCSDGVGAFVTDGTTNRQFGSTLASVIAQPVDVLHMVNLISFDMRSADDDRTALVVWQDVGSDASTS